MPLTHIAQKIGSIDSIKFVVDNAGNITAIKATCGVNYGTWSQTEVVDIYPSLTEAQKKAAQSFYNKLKMILQEIILG